MNLTIRRDDSAELRDHVERYHYLHRYPAPRSLPFGYRLLVDSSDHAPDGRLWGVIIMKKLQHHKQTGLFGYPGLPTAWQVLDLARVWIHPDLQQPRWITPLLPQRLYIFSQFVSRVLKRVQWDWLVHHPPYYPDLPYHILLIVSYCELAHHDGGAYRASSFTRFGMTSDGSKELYYRRLRQPLKAWRPIAPVQWPLLDGIPLRHG